MTNIVSTLAKVVIALLVTANLTTLATHALADDECHDPIEKWQPREALKTRLQQQGWVVHRIRIDDGCYEVRALDEQGRKVKATFAPASLTLLELDVKHEKHEKHDKPDQS